MIEILIAKVFNTRNLTHLSHWRTKSYAQHQALGSFYETIPSHIDRIVEVYQGSFGLVSIPELPGAVFKKDITKHLEEEVAWITENQKDICKGISALGNLVDGLVEEYFSTIYKLKNLS